VFTARYELDLSFIQASISVQIFAACIYQREMRTLPGNFESDKIFLFNNNNNMYCRLMLSARNKLVL
jgi:hypothetical protein